MMLFHTIFLYDDGLSFDYYSDSILCSVLHKGMRHFVRPTKVKWPVSSSEGNFCTFFDNTIKTEAVENRGLKPRGAVDIVWNWESVPKDFDYKAYNNEQFNEKKEVLRSREGQDWVIDLLAYLRVGV